MINVEAHAAHCRTADATVIYDMCEVHYLYSWFGIACVLARVLYADFGNAHALPPSVLVLQLGWYGDRAGTPPPAPLIH